MSFLVPNDFDPEILLQSESEKREKKKIFL